MALYGNLVKPVLSDATALRFSRWCDDLPRMRTLLMRRHTYLGDGRCIFCMRSFENCDLTDEHIIPEAIHGSLVIKGGACKPCARLTNNEYENEALNNDLQVARFLLDLRGKSKGAAVRDVRHLPAVYEGNTTMRVGGERLMPSLNDYPKIFQLIGFPPPGLLVGVDRGADLYGPVIKVFTLGPGRRPGGLRGVTLEQKFTNGKFAKMLAKIGYCYAVAELGLDGFDGNDMRALLQGTRDDVYNFVGDSGQPEHLTKRHLHGLYLRQRGLWHTVLVHLFASLDDDPQAPSSSYEVVVGKIA